MISIGSKAPDFKINIDDGTNFTLSDYLGQKVIVYFYPKDNTPGCTTEACDFRESIAQFNQLKCKVLGISRDSVATHAKFKEKYNLNFPLGADEDGAVCQLYGVWVQKSMFGKKYFGVNRATFLIDEDGIVKHIWPSVSVSSHIKDILTVLQS
ncbi:thioredoxin-dependent thiol peroxidase [Candidatus Bodocaedibacter vickermanii]|uniref:thioredoxin-dependent peroxiredoxin n=1 Tax=Candidatus Bodocaedibacter vickermanii TaxID=2741701 RepID=A0A7L9RS94_9PROT|nr:thioredoxin-dependent thiol peroxidase [Candidatus Paracaedibacteraceae bacterium 'Lake Konstanz']